MKNRCRRCCFCGFDEQCYAEDDELPEECAEDEALDIVEMVEVKREVEE